MKLYDPPEPLNIRPLRLSATAAPQMEFLNTLHQLRQDGFELRSPNSVEPAVFLSSVEAGQKDCQLVAPPDKVALPVRGVEDLAVLSAVYHAGAPALAAHPGLAHVLSSMHTAGAVFKAVDSKSPGYNGDYNSPEVNVGPYGTYLRLSGQTPHLHRLSVEVMGRSVVRPDAAEELVAYHVFHKNGDTADLQEPQMGTTLKAVESGGGACYLHREVSAEDAYLSLLRGEAKSVELGRGGDQFMEVTADQLRTDPTVAASLQERLQRFDRIRNTRGGSLTARAALSVLDEPVGNHPIAEREDAMVAVLALPRTWQDSELDDYRAVVAQARDDEPLAETVAQFGQVVGQYRSPQRKDVYQAWPFYRALPGAEQKQFYFDLLSRTQDHGMARDAMQTLGPQHLPQLDRVLAAEADMRAAPRDAVESLQVLQRTLRAGETLEDAVEWYGELLAVRKWEPEDAHQALHVMREDLPKAAPTDMSVQDKERRFLELLLAGDNQVSTAWTTWKELSAGGTASDFEARRAILHRILPRHDGRLEASTDDLRQLDDFTRGRGGLQGAEAERLLHLMDVSHTFEQARDALGRVERAALPVKADEREAIYVALADAHGREKRADSDVVEDLMHDYWYVVRNTQSPPLETAREYGQFLRAAGGDSREARIAHGWARENAVPAAAMLAALEATGKAEGARGLAKWAQTEDRLQAAARILPLARRLREDEPLAESMHLVDAMSSLGGKVSVTEAVGHLADAFANVEAPRYSSSKQPPMQRIGETLVKPYTDRDALTRDLKEFARLPHTWEMLDVWPTIRDSAPHLPLTDKVSSLSTLLASGRVGHDEVLDVYHTVLEGATDSQHLTRNTTNMALLLTQFFPSGCCETYKNISQAVGTDEARFHHYTQLVASGAVDTDDVRSVLQLVQVPFGTEPATQRDAAMSTLIQAEKGLSASNSVREAGRDYLVLGESLFPGERIDDNAKLFAELAEAVQSGQVAREALGQMQQDRLNGFFADTSLRDLTNRFAAAYVVNRDVGSSLESLHQNSNPGTVVKEDDAVTIGGLRIPRKRAVMLLSRTFGPRPLEIRLGIPRDLMQEITFT